MMHDLGAGRAWARPPFHAGGLGAPSDRQPYACARSSTALILPRTRDAVSGILSPNRPQQTEHHWPRDVGDRQRAQFREGVGFQA